MTAESEEQLTGVVFGEETLIELDPVMDDPILETATVRREFNQEKMMDVRQLAEDNRLPERG